MTPPILPGLAPLADRYDAFVIDLWGCVHNGVAAYPAAADALARLGRAGKRRLLLSNAPRRAALIPAQLERMGIVAGEHFDDVLTSGEACWLALASRADPWHAALGTRALHLGPARDLSLFEGNGLTRTTDPGDADFVLLTGPNDDSFGLAEHAGALAAARARGLRAVCANPDREVIRGAERLICAGALALAYEALGGETRWHGKPYPEIYALALERLGRPDPARVLCVGDGLLTDIAGAAAAGLDSAFIPGGVHGAAHGLVMGVTPDPAGLAALLAGAPAQPRFVIPGFAW
jgi:HAD superfamily hydrolase (TIGR01459 family)